MPPFLAGLRKVLKLPPKETAPQPHPLQATLENKIASVRGILRETSKNAELEKHKPIMDTLQVLNLQVHQALATYAETKGDKEKALVTGVLEKLDAKIEAVKADAIKLRDAAAAGRKQWKALAPAYSETVKFTSELAGMESSAAGPLGESLAALEAEAKAHRYPSACEKLQALQPQARQAFEKASAAYDSTEAVEKLHAAYLSRTATSTDPLDDFAARLDELAAIQAAIEVWQEKHEGAERETAKAGAKKLEALANTVAAELQKVGKERDALRKETKEKMLEQIKNASADERKKLSMDQEFIAKLEKYLPPGAVEYAWKQLGMGELEIEQESLGKIETSSGESVWDDQDILGPDYREYMKFETTEIEPTNNPGVTRKLTIPPGVHWKDEATGETKWYPEGATVEILGTTRDGTIKFARSGGKVGLIKKIVPMGGGKVKLKEVEHQRENTPLFPSTPKKGDILQGAIGDCYLLAAVTSLVTKDPGAIMDMMNDKGGTVTVRLFDVHTKDGKKEFKPRFFNIEKSVLRDGNGKALYAANSVWVQMLEKAYAAGGFSGTVDKKDIAKYENIADGYIYHAYSVLTGKEAQQFPYEIDDDAKRKDVAITDTLPNGKIRTQTLPWSAQERSDYRGTGSSTAEFRSLICWDIYTGDRNRVHQWMAYVSTGTIEQLFDREYSGGYSGEVTIPDFYELFQGRIKQPDGTVTAVTPLAPALGVPVLRWIESNRLYPGKRGTPEYSELQLKMYAAIKDALDKGKMVGLGSKKTVGRVQSGTGHSGGESISGGLVGSHAYTVFEVREDGGMKSLLIRNPWGKTVQRNITVADRILELNALPILQEYDANALVKQRLEREYNAKKAEKSRATDPRQGLLIQAEMDRISGEWCTVRDRQNEIAKENEHQERDRLKKQNGTDLISVEEDQSSDTNLGGGEFWLPLSDLTLRFSSYHVC